MPRSEADFDPGAKYHIPANTPYTRYFLSVILQFQFHKALCAAAGNNGPLYECSIYGNAEAGAKFAQMLAARRASAPWQDALEKLTGSARDRRRRDHRVLPAAACSGWRSRTRDSSAAGSRARSGYSVTRTSVTKYSVSPKHELGTHLCCS